MNMSSNSRSLPGTGMETDPLRAIWNAIQQPIAPLLSFEEMRDEFDRALRRLHRHYPVDSGDYLSLVAIGVLEATRTRDAPPLSLRQFRHIVNSAAYQIRKTYGRVIADLHDVADSDPSHETVVDRADIESHLKAFLAREFSPTELSLLAIAMSYDTATGARKLGISEVAFRQRRSRLLARIRALYSIMPD